MGERTTWGSEGYVQIVGFGPKSRFKATSYGVAFLYYQERWDIMQGSTGALFIGALKPSDKSFLKTLLENALKEGYERFVEPCAGALAMSFLAAEAGFNPKKIEASDVSYFSGVLGRAVSDKALDDMCIQAEGFTKEELQDPAVALYAQLYLRTVSKAGKDYFLELLKDLQYRRKEYIEDIREQINIVKGKCKGMSYRDLDLQVHIDEVLDDPKAVIVLCPPTYTAGYEKFFDTQGRLKWREPSYGIFDCDTGVRDLYEKVKDAKALVIIYEERAIGDYIGTPVYGRDAGRAGMYMYLVANRPEEAKRLANGKDIERKAGVKMTPLKKPILPSEYIVTEKSVVEVMPIKAENATYYRRLWTHNFVGGASGSAMAMLIDGYVAGVFGYDKFTMSLGSGKDLLFKFGMTAPSEQRLNRLMYMLAVNKECVFQFLNDIQRESTAGVMTIMLTKYPESKEMRGLMKLVGKQPEGKNGFKLKYRCDIQDKTKQEVLREWLQKEARWKKARESSKKKA